MLTVTNASGVVKPQAPAPDAGPARDSFEVAPSLVFHDMGFEDLALLMPGRFIDRSIRPQATCDGLSHVQCMMCVVVRKQALSSKRQNAVESIEPVVDSPKLLLEATPVQGIDVAQAAHVNRAHRSADRQTCQGEAVAHQIGKFIIRHRPDAIVA